MITETKANFLGIPIDGDITRGARRADQRPLSEMEPLIRAVLDDDFIDSIGWRQYTPYFNDGEPCEFGVGEPWFRTVEDVKGKPANRYDDDDEDEEDDDEDDYSYVIGYRGHPTLGHRESHWDNPSDWENRKRIYHGSHEATYDACVALAEAINSGAFENVLLEAFGDHACVTIRRDGITVDEYSHE
jgi:hypothetical protein